MFGPGIPTLGVAPPKVPGKPDAIEFAYLTGGVNHVIRTTLFDLRQRGYVRLDDDALLAPAQPPAREHALDALEFRVLLALTGGPRKPAEIFTDGALIEDIERLCAPVRRRLDEERLLPPAEVDRRARSAFDIGRAAIIGLSAIELLSPVGQISATSARDDLILLILLAIAAWVALYRIVVGFSSKTLSSRGGAFLERVRRVYRGRLGELADTLRRAEAGEGGARVESSSLYLVAIFGYAPLMGVYEHDFIRMFERSMQ